MTPPQNRQTPPTPAPHDRLFAGLDPLAARLNTQREAIDGLCGSPHRPIATQARRLRGQMRDFAPSVTFIGQVKAGKTTLVNALAGWPGLLPADVNPWTSVVTSLHLEPGHDPAHRRASFRFFTNEEWDHLIRQGGRVGELARRAGAAEEVEKVRAQLDEMRAKSRRRLGDQFHLLLGQTHKFDTFDEALIKRYVCMGDDFWDDPELSAGLDPAQGRFADITRSADLWLPRPGLPLPLTLQDTPGINDTFMIREQITINALRGSRLCVVVLSAQQALSAVDLGLVRLISNVKSRDIIIFVNRIDDLADPARDVPQIRASIEATLKRFDGPTGARLIFGSAGWASHAQGGSLSRLSGAAGEKLLSWAESRVDDTIASNDPQEVVWHLSGLPELGAAIAERVVGGAGARFESAMAKAVDNLRTGAQAHIHVTSARDLPIGQTRLTPPEAEAAVREIAQRAQERLETALLSATTTFDGRAEKARSTFLGRATQSLLSHLKNYGEGEVWTFDPAGLRVLLRSAVRVFVQSTSKEARETFEAAAEEITGIYHAHFGLPVEGPGIAAPTLPQAHATVSLGQTIALDLKGGWWTRFWRRRKGYEAFADQFTQLIDEETRPMIQNLRETTLTPFAEALRESLSRFLAEQSDMMQDLARRGQSQTETATARPRAGRPSLRQIG